MAKTYEGHWGCYDCNVGDTTKESLKENSDGDECCPHCFSTSLFFPVNFSVVGLVTLLRKGTKQVKTCKK